jgi:hypothetical protein
LLVLGDDNRALQADICELCELWYHQQRDGREALVPQTIYYLVCKTLDDESPKVADLKRLYALKEGLSLIDFAAPRYDHTIYILTITDDIQQLRRSQAVVATLRGTSVLFDERRRQEIVVVFIYYQRTTRRRVASYHQVGCKL